VSLGVDAGVERQARPLGDGVGHGVAELLVLGQLAPVRLDLDRRQHARVGAEEELEQRRGAQLEDRVGGLRAPVVEGLAALGGDRVELAPAPAALAPLAQVAGLGEPGGLALELRVLERPEVAHGLGRHLLEPIGRGLPCPADEAEHDERDRVEPQILH
jgi:hypothetical protein